MVDSLKQPGQAGTENDIEVTPEMVEAGFKVLCNSGIADDYLAADKCTVTEIYLAMTAVRPAGGRRDPAS